MKSEITISHDLLIQAGYVNWKNDEHNSYYQKRILDDNNQTKYFIDIRKVEVHNFVGWFPSIQFNLKENEQSVSIQLIQWLNASGIHTGITIDDFEKYLKKVWIKLEGTHYEN